jgi:hypothetical protein
MIANDVLVLSWLVLAHLMADFVLQTERMAIDKFAAGRRAWRGLAAHWFAVAVAMLPVPFAFGGRGLIALVVISVLHAVIDRTKVVLTRRVEAAALEEAALMHEGPSQAASLGSAWTPVPAALFILDQIAHLLVIAWAWAVFLRGTPLESGWATAWGGALGGFDQAGLHRVVLTGVVIVALTIVNVRAGSLFVATLVNPREVVLGGDPVESGPVAEDTDAAERAATYTFRVGPFVARAEPAVPPRPVPAIEFRSLASPERVGEAIGVLERLLIVTFVLTANQAAVGFVVAAKTLARFKQLDDRRFAEYYLLGTLASVSVALASGLLAAAALSA